MDDIRMLTPNTWANCKDGAEIHNHQFCIHRLLLFLKDIPNERCIPEYMVNGGEWQTVESTWRDEINRISSNLYQYESIDAAFSNGAVGFLTVLDGQKELIWLERYDEDGSRLEFIDELLDDIFTMYKTPYNKLWDDFSSYPLHELEIKDNLELISSKHLSKRKTKEDQLFAKKEVYYLLKLLANYNDGTAVYFKFTENNYKEVQLFFNKEEIPVSELIYKLNLGIELNTDYCIYDNDGNIVIKHKFGKMEVDEKIVLYDENDEWVDCRDLYDNEAVSEQQLRDIIDEEREKSPLYQQAK